MPIYKMMWCALSHGPPIAEDPAPTATPQVSWHIGTMHQRSPVGTPSSRSRMDETIARWSPVDVPPIGTHIAFDWSPGEFWPMAATFTASPRVLEETGDQSGQTGRSAEISTPSCRYASSMQMPFKHWNTMAFFQLAPDNLLYRCLWMYALPDDLSKPRRRRCTHEPKSWNCGPSTQTLRLYVLPSVFKGVHLQRWKLTFTHRTPAEPTSKVDGFSVAPHQAQCPACQTAQRMCACPARLRSYATWTTGFRHGPNWSETLGGHCGMPLGYDHGAPANLRIGLAWPHLGHTYFMDTSGEHPAGLWRADRGQRSWPVWAFSTRAEWRLKEPSGSLRLGLSPTRAQLADPSSCPWSLGARERMPGSGYASLQINSSPNMPTSREV